MQVTADALTLGLMVWASVLDPDVAGEKETIDYIYLSCMLVQVGVAVESWAWEGECIWIF